MEQVVQGYGAGQAVSEKLGIPQRQAALSASGAASAEEVTAAGMRRTSPTTFVVAFKFDKCSTSSALIHLCNHAESCGDGVHP